MMVEIEIGMEAFCYIAIAVGFVAGVLVGYSIGHAVGYTRCKQ